MKEKEKAKIYSGAINTRFIKRAIPPSTPCSVPSSCALSCLKLPYDVSSHRSFPPGHCFPNRRGRSCEHPPPLPTTLKSGKLFYVRLIPWEGGFIFE